MRSFPVHAPLAGGRGGVWGGDGRFGHRQIDRHSTRLFARWTRTIPSERAGRQAARAAYLEGGEAKDGALRVLVAEGRDLHGHGAVVFGTLGKAFGKVSPLFLHGQGALFLPRRSNNSRGKAFGR